MSTDTINKHAQAARQAAGRIADHILTTPLRRSSWLSEHSRAKVFFKLENLQHTGSFKLRGAMNSLLMLPPSLREMGCVAASSGNHGAAVARAAQELGVDAVIFVPEKTSQAKIAVIEDSGGDVRFFGTDGLDTETHARDFARRNGRHYLSPYNDEHVIAGQGSCGVEILQQCPDVDAVFIAVGGGGLISGVGSVLKQHRPAIRVIGCQPRNSPVMSRSVEAGRVLEIPSLPTLSDGTAGGIEPDSITFELCAQLVDEWVLVDESAIAAAMRDYESAEQQLIEGAAGVAIAGFEQLAAEYEGQKVVVLICGGNISRR